MAGPVSVSFDYHDHFHIFCLYAVHTSGFDFVNGKIELPESETGELQRQLRIDDRCLEFGEYAVIIPAVPFLTQLKDVLQRSGHWFKGSLVEYYDDTTFHGEIEPKDIPFRKQKRFSYQKEFRICVQTAKMGDDPITIDIGDISHMTAKVESSRLNGLFEVKLERAPSAQDGAL